MRILGDEETNNLVNDGGKICASYWPLKTEEEGIIGVRIETENEFLEIASRTSDEGGNHIYTIVDGFIDYYRKMEEDFDEEIFLKKLKVLRKLFKN